MSSRVIRKAIREKTKAAKKAAKNMSSDVARIQNAKQRIELHPDDQQLLDSYIKGEKAPKDPVQSHLVKTMLKMRPHIEKCNKDIIALKTQINKLQSNINEIHNVQQRQIGAHDIALSDLAELLIAKRDESGKTKVEAEV
jgi:translation initiation factor 2B subunit (eIF-2B alpha/beta/delta family)